MRRRVLSALSVVAASIWLHTAYAQRPEATARPTTTLARMTFTLGGASLAIFLPEAAVVHNLTGRDKIYIDLTKGKRLERWLILQTAPHGPGANYDKTMILTNGGHLEYRTEDNTGGGSGGPVAELRGRMEVGSLILAVTCTDQDEGSREPDWCLPYLSGLEIVERNR